MSELSKETEDLLARGRVGAPLLPAHRERLRGAVMAKAAAASIATTATASAWSALAVKVVGIGSAVVLATGVGVLLGERDRVANRASSLAAAPMAAPAPSRAPTAVAVEPPWPPEIATAPKAILPRPSPKPIAQHRAAPEALPVETLAVPAPASTMASPSPSASTLEEEARLLREAHRAVAEGDAITALRLLDEHAARFLASALEPERSAERVFALCSLGRLDEARLAARAFLAAHSDGPLASRVRGSCASASR